MSDRHIAVADEANDRVSVFSVGAGGGFIRYVGVGVLAYPLGVAASAFDELVVADSGNRCLRVFSATGDLLASVGEGGFTGVVVHGGGVLAADPKSSTVSVFM
jgi:DNA-binding beta-propeller fold protein YncE